MPNYLLLLHADEGRFQGKSPEELQGIYMRYRKWREEIVAKGIYAGGNKLRDASGRVMKQSAGKVIVTDGPYAETREILGGYFMITADTYESAVEISRSCPHIDFGTIEIREVETT
jgi:hypothetical protein